MDDADEPAGAAAPTAMAPVAGDSDPVDGDEAKRSLLRREMQEQGMREQVTTWLGNRSALVRKLIATALLLIMCAAWIALAETTQAIQAANYKKPYFLAWLAHSAYLVFLPIFVSVQWFRRRANPTLPISFFPWRVYWRQGAILGVVTFLVLYLWYLSLDRTQVAPNTSIYQSTCVFVYAFSIFLFKEKLTLPRVGAVVLCLAGVFMVAFSSTTESETPNETALGYILVIVSTILYALYEVLYRFLAPVDPDNQLTAPLFVLGLIGILTAAVLWFGLPIVHWSGFEVFEWPPSELAGALTLTVLMESVYNLALFGAILCTTPLYVSIGTMLTVPTAVLADWLLHGYVMSAVSWAGVALIAVGYILLNLLPVS